MLSLYAFVRFALSRSPLREQRELLLKNQDPKDPQKPHEGPQEPEPETERTFDDDRLVERETKDTGAKISSVLRVLDSQEIFDRLGEELKNGEAFDRLFTQEESMKEIDLASVATKAGIAIYMSERESVLPSGSPRAVLSAIVDFDTAQGFPIAVKRTFIEMLLRASPGITAAFARSTLTRIKNYEEQQAAIETARERFRTQEMLGKIGEEGMAVASRLSLGEIPNIQAAVNEIGTKHPLTMDQVRELYTTLDNVSEAMCRIREFGNRYWGTAEVLPAEQDEKQKLEYLKQLKEQARDLARLLSIQLRLGAQETVQNLEEAAAAAMKQTKAKDLQDEIQRNAADPGMRALKLIAKVDDPENDLVQDPDNANFTRLSDAFLREAEGHLATLDSIRRDADQLRNRWRSPEGLKEETRDRQERQAWAARCLAMLKTVLTDPALSAGTIQSLETFQSQLNDPAVLSAFSEEEMAREEYVSKILLEQGESVFNDANREGTAALRIVTSELTDTDTRTWIGDKKKETKRLENELSTLLTHPVCATLGVGDLVQAYAKDLTENLDFLAGAKITDAKKKEMCERIGVQLQHWQSAVSLIRTLENATSGTIPPNGNECIRVLPRLEYLKKFGVATSKACYFRGLIYVREDVPQSEWPGLIEHEKAHFLISILSDQSHLLPELFDLVFDEITAETWQSLEGRADRWGIFKEAIRAQFMKENPTMPRELLERRVEARFRRALLEEAAVRGALAAEGHDDRALLNSLKQKEGTPFESDTPLHSTDDEAIPTVDAQQMEQAPAATGAYDAHEDLEAIEHMINSIETFGNAYGTPEGGRHYNPRFKREADEIVGNGHGDGGYRDVLNELKHIHANGKMRNGTEVDPEHNEKYIETVQNFKEHVSNTTKKVEALDKHFAEISGEPVSRVKSFSEMIGIRWHCILDIMRMYKEFKEDIEGIWHSIQDNKTADTKAAWTKNLPVYIPGTTIKIPIIGKYTERLPHYTERARNSKELERVKKWEDSFTNLDAEELLKVIGETPTRDQLRASIELLVKKGRMNWGDQRVWKALNEKSKYTMPIGPCDRDETLRDKWLHKLISDIWLDKDMFNEWMTGNSGNFDKHKQSYTHEADNFANIAGKTAYELHVMLRTYVDCTTSTPKKPLPEDVNPHHYEELLHYSMRNGKMSMEQKVFFLIQGIASGFMPLERLRALAGEKGGVLLKFPFLDYFYQRHNSLSDIKNISNRLTERGPDGKPTFLPGTKTTMFMRLVLLRDQKALERISKALDKGAEGLDHEDIPYLATEIDWVKMLSLLGVMSGARSKVSKEGWKNAYVGFNEKFKVYANLARLAQEKKAIMTDGDVRNLAQSIGAYIVMDNQMMRATDLKAGQVSLSTEALEIERPVANPNLRTADYRNRTREFVWRLAHAIGMQDSDLGIAGITMKQFLANAERDQTTVPPDIIKKLDEAREPFIRALTQKIANNPDTLMRVLAEFEGGEMSKGKKFLDSQVEDEKGTKMMNYKDFSERYRSIIGQENGA
ncbi:MAG: hypothetical protein PHX87_03680 [Candidatus Peribacteraceae bacterium]|nr:hypothetical protein [Candidatus Peribacteraceae bacterium]MDD5742505.1 hypothetical protein [Candidatus Peribacteraceae bacterium]